MIPLVDVVPRPFLDEATIRGFYSLLPMTICVKGLNGMAFSGLDALTNSTVIHEYTHHLQLSCTSGGLGFHLSQAGLTTAIFGFARHFRDAYPSTAVPVPISRALQKRDVRESMPEQCSRVLFEIQFRNAFLGWPFDAPPQTCPQIGVIYDDGSVHSLPVGYLLLAENHARVVQMDYLSASPAKRMQIETIRIGAAETTESFQRRFLRYCSLSHGFIDNLNAGDSVGRRLFLWASVKALMTPMIPYFNSPEEGMEYTRKRASHEWAKGFWPGRRYIEMAMLMFHSDLRDRIITVCKDGDFVQLDQLVSDRLSWPKQDEVIQQIEEQQARVQSPVLKRVIESVVYLHRNYPDFLLYPPRFMDTLMSRLPPVSWMNQRGWIGVSDFWSITEQLEIANWSVLASVMTSILTGQEISCPYQCRFSCSERCQRILGTRREPDDCPLEAYLQHTYRVSLADFEPIHEC